ncbi:MAG: hypothetical protein ACYC61_07900 [Isosphaeraceae bacterium]
MNTQLSHDTADASASAPTSEAYPAATAASPSFKAGLLDRARCVAAYLWGERRALLVTVVSLTVVVLFLIGHALDWSRVLTWEALSIVSSVLAFSVGVTVFLNEAVENSEARLPKRLSVYFVDPDAEITRLVCQQAHLTGEADIRAWSQQIGRQIYQGNLDFTPFPELRRLGVEKREGAIFTHYQAVFRLRTVPAALKTELDTEEAIRGFPVAKVLKPRANDSHGQVDIVPDDARNYQPVR